MPMRIGAALPPLDGAVEWLNGPQPAIQGDRAPVVIHFWALSCSACKANMPDVQALRDKYTVSGVRFIAVHTRRSPGDKELKEVRRIAEEIGITEPCALDDAGAIGNRFELSGMWPYYFLFDHDGRMKRRGAGGIGLRLLKCALAEIVG